MVLLSRDSRNSDAQRLLLLVGFAMKDRNPLGRTVFGKMRKRPIFHGHDGKVL
jgi:hypothetical protein